MDNHQLPLNTPWLSRFSLIAIGIALCVIVLGAYTRLKDAGLGCPDWPGCYGQLIAPSSEQDIAAANAAYPDMPVETAKARTEMTHRYFAETLGFLILLLGLFTFIQRKKNAPPLWLAALLIMMVIFQGMLGMWTVTLRLLPLTVMAHLLGGFCTLALLWLYFLMTRSSPFQNETTRITHFNILHRWSILTFIVLIAQIFLGGWTSANYAALLCPDFPQCQGMWWPTMDFTHAFNLFGGIGMKNPLMFMNGIDRTTIHVTHRLGALVTTFLGIGLIALLLKQSFPLFKRLAWIIALLLFTQILLGLANVLLHLPLILAVSHNAVAALFLLSLVTLVYYLHLYQKEVLICPVL